MNKIIVLIIFSGLFQISQAQTVTYQYDDLNRLTQADYGNGTIIQYSFDKLGNRTQYVITGSATPPDLQATALAVDNPTVSPGGQTTMSYTLLNNGQIAAGQNTARFYINTSTSLTGATEVDDHSFSSVAGNSSTQYSQLLTIPSGTATGNQYLLIDLDADDDVVESNESNNLASIPITIQDCPTFTISFPNVTNETCEEGNGSIVAASGGGSYPYSWEWNTIPPQYSNIASNLSAGTYSVTLIDADGCGGTGTHSIINDGVNPVSGFTASTAGLTVSFTSTATGATSWLWNFGDGGTSTQQNASHTYTVSGSYTVCLETSNACGTDNSCQTVTVDAGEYVEIESAPGVQLLRKETANDDPDFIQVIDLSAGAYIEFDHGDITSGAGTSNPFFTRENIDNVWTEKTGQYDNVFSVTNGQFFNAGQSPAATLAWPVKQNGAMVSDGYANTSEYVGEKEFLGIWTDYANSSSYNDNPTSVANSSALHGIVGLDKDANKVPNNQTGRTFAGVKDEDGDGVYEKVLIFSSKSATQAYAAQQLNDMGVPFDKILMLDGGGSTQMKCNGTDYVDQSRLLPQFMVIYSASVAPNDDCVHTTPISCGETVSGSTENATFDQNIVFSEDFDQCNQPSGWTLSAIDTFNNSVATTVGTCDGPYMYSFNCTNGYPSSGNPAPGFSGCQAILDANGVDPNFVGTIYLTSPNIDLSAGGSRLFIDYENEAYGENGTFKTEVWDGNSWILWYTTSNDRRGRIVIPIWSYSNSDFKVRFSYYDAGINQWGLAIDNIIVTDQSGIQECGVELFSPGVWYSFVGDGNIAKLSTCGSTFDTRLSVYSGDCNSLNCIGGNDDSENCFVSGTDESSNTQVTFQTIDGENYRVLVHGWINTVGAFDLNLECTSPITNDKCLNAAQLDVNEDGTCPTLSVPGSTISATTDYINNNCGTNENNLQNNGVWYYFTAPSSEMVEIELNTITGDQRMIVYHYTSCPECSCRGAKLVCTQDHNIQLSDLVPGDTYKILVWSLSGNEGDFSICISEITCNSDVIGGIPTTLTHNNGASGNMFNITNNSDCNINLTGFDVNIDNGNTEVQVWYTTSSSSYIGLEEDESAWTMLGAETVSSIGPGNPTFVNVGGLVLSPGEEKGIYVAAQTINIINYTNGNGSNQNYNDGFLSIEAGAGKGFPNFNNQTYSPRVWNGKVYYNNQIDIPPANTVLLSDIKPSFLELTYPSAVDATTVIDDNVFVYGSISGLKAGSYTTSNSIVTFTPNTNFVPGEEIMVISKPEVLSSIGESFPKAVFKELMVASSGLAEFSELYTGIELTSAMTNYSYSFLATDVNSDGNTDILYSYYTSYGANTNLLVYIGNTDGSFGSPTTYTGSYSHSSLRGTPDLNSDGYPDVVTTQNAFPSSVHVRLNNGDGTFGSESVYAVTNYSGGVDFCDMNGNGYIDMVGKSGNASINSNTISIFFNNGDGTFQSQVTTSTNAFGRSLAPADIDNDGDIDIVYVSGSPTYGGVDEIRVYSNDGDGGLTLENSADNTALYSIFPSLQDFNGDGFKDLRVGSVVSALRFGDGTFNLDFTNLNTLDATSNSYQVGDLDGDNDMDVFMVIGSSVRIFINDGFGNMITNDFPIEINRLPYPDIIDMDEDGDIDVLFERNDSLFIAINGSSPVPIELLHFSAQSMENNKVLLDWETANEENNSHFVIQRSKNAVNWNDVEKVLSNESYIYKSIDFDPYYGISFYRLKQFDNDGAFSYSDIRSVKIIEENTISIYPNPTRNEVVIEGDANEISNLKVFNILGQNVTSQIPVNNLNDQKIVLELKALVAGIYYLKTRSNTNIIFKE